MVDTSHWVFGYGSLIWRADFPFINKRPAYIKGWARRFWQGSTDHRGIPGAPGRVVTLIESTDEICWGMAYELRTDSQQSVMTALDHREKGGYEQLTLPLFFQDGPGIHGTTYYADPGNPDYLGEADVTDIARQILDATGPSGSNLEYLYNLEAALMEFPSQDPHVTSIANKARNLQQRRLY